MNYKAYVLSLTLILGAGLSCDQNPTAPLAGGISVVLLTESGAPLAISATNGAVSARADGEGQLAWLALDGVRVTVAGPTNKTVTVTTSTGGFFDVSVTGLAPGSYTVTVEGLLGGEVDHFGQTAGVNVTAGANTPATVTFPSFQPTLTSSVPDTTEVLHFTVAYNAVPGATSYVVRWGTSPTFVGATSVPVTGTSTEIVVPSEGKYYVSVKAVNSAVSSGGRASDAKAVFAYQGVATVTVTPATPVIAAGGTQQFAAEARDGDGNIVSNVTWFWASSNHPVATINQSGLATGVAGGAATITAVGKGTPGSATLSVGANVATKLTFSIQPTNSVAGDPLSPAVQVEIQDANGNRVTDARDGVTIAIGANPGSGTLTGTKVVNAINGIASFSGLWINKSGSGYTLSASSGSLTAAASSGFDISPAAPAKLAFSQQPTNVEGNAVIAPSVTVTIADQFDNAVTSASNQVTVSFGTNPWRSVFSSGATLFGTRTVSAVSGVATFSTLRVDKPGPGFTLAGTSSSLTAALSSAFNVNLTVSAVSAGNTHTCAIAPSGNYCWGGNFSGQLGAVTGQTVTDSVPALVRGSLNFVQITAGSQHSCGRTLAGAAYCWGYNGSGQLGDGTTTNRDQPVAVTGSHQFATISAGESHTCGVTTAGAGAEDRQVYCWGNNNNGQLGDNSTTQRLTPAQVAQPLRTTTHATSVSAGATHTCAVGLDGNAYCWGSDSEGQIGDNVADPLVDKLVPTQVVAAFFFNAVSAGGLHSCGIRASNSAAYCWGRGTEGQLGDNPAGSPVNQPGPVLVAGGFAFTSVNAGYLHTCGVTTVIGANGYCWGYNQDGELGDGNQPNNSKAPVLISGGLTFNAIDSGAFHSCGRINSSVVCWGIGYYGHLGHGAVVNFRATPVQIVQ